MATTVVARRTTLAWRRPCVCSSFMKVQQPAQVPIRHGYRSPTSNKSPRTDKVTSGPSRHVDGGINDYYWETPWESPQRQTMYERSLPKGSIAYKAYMDRSLFFPPNENEFERLSGTPLVSWDEMHTALHRFGVACKPSGYVNEETMNTIRKNISSDDMIQTGRAFMRSRYYHFRLTGNAIILSFAMHGEPSEIVLLNTMRRHYDERKSPFSKHEAYLKSALQNLAHENDIEAMILWGQILAYDEGKVSEGEKLLEKAQYLSGIRSIPRSVNCLPASSVLGDILVELGRVEDAHAAFKTGALRHSDPYAYFQLAVLENQQSPYSTDWLSYLTKSAASGYELAANDLGEFYDMPKDRIPKGSGGWQEAARLGRISYRHPLIPHDIDGMTGMALEWSEAAYMGKINEAGLRMARILIRHGAYGTANSLLRDLLASKDNFMVEDRKSKLKETVQLQYETVEQLQRLRKSSSSS